MKGKIKITPIYYIVSVVALLVVLGITGVKFYNTFINIEEKPMETKENLDALELYGYTLDDKDTEVYKKYFEELKSTLNEEELDKIKYAENLTKLFVVDVYTLSNKLTSTDIGGLEFIHPDLVDNFKINLGDTMYNNIENNIYGGRTQELPEVSEVNVLSSKKREYTYNGKKYEAYEVSLEWKFVKDMGYETKGNFILIFDKDKLNVVEKVK